MNEVSTPHGTFGEEPTITGLSNILFDMDGVLINSEPLHEFTLLELSSQFGRRFENESELQQFKGLPEVSIANLLKKIFPAVALENQEISAPKIGTAARKLSCRGNDRGSA